ncbi:MAG TPA: RraA family protein [Rhizomicrobium sp.]|nr:RraA family protein [Rhizomicrobium sp.]
MRIHAVSWKGKSVLFLAGGLLTCLVGGVVAQPLPDAKAYAANPALLIDAYRHVEVASVSDALEQTHGMRSFMSHRIHAISDGKIAGFAVTVQMDKAEGSAPAAVTPMQEVLDKAPPASVYVMSVAEGDDIAGIGGLMATAMNARGFSGAVIEGGVRDVAYLKKIAFPVYATGIVPSTSVGHYRATGNVPVTAGGVRVTPGDIVVADADGVVVVPRDIAAEVLVKAQTLDQTEHSMYGYIEKFRSLEEAVQRFGRL